MGRKPKKGLREAILAEAAEQPSSASMLRLALESRTGTEPATLTGVIKAAEGLRAAGLLAARKAMPEVYHGARTRTYYETTPKGVASLKNAVAEATAGWTGARRSDAAPAAESETGDSHDDHDPATEVPKKIYVAMIIDKSGSMRDMTTATVEGFNEYLGSAKVENPGSLMSVTLFDADCDELYVGTPIGQVLPLTEERYTRGGMGQTALNDAIGRTVTAIERAHGSAFPDVLVVIMTDGHENASKEWTKRSDIAKMVKRKEADGWRFVFFGTTIDAFTEGSSLNIPASRSVAYLKTDEGTRGTYRRASAAASAMARGESEERWTERLSEDEK